VINAIGEGRTQVNLSLGDAILSPAVGISQADLPPSEECVHFWLIDTPNGPTSQGTCKQCGKIQLFRNSVASSTWNRGVARRENEWL